MSIEVSGLYTYPIKGCQAVSHDAVEVVETGLAYDRAWMIVDATNSTPITQREHPDIAIIDASVKEEVLTIEVPYFGWAQLDISKPSGAQKRAITLFDKTGEAVPEGSGANDLLSGFIGKKVQLMRIVKHRPIHPSYLNDGMNKVTGFADGAPIHLASENSLNELNRWLAKQVGMDRFRPNVVVRSDEMPPYDEDYWRELKIGSMAARVVRATARCVVPNIDQVSGKPNPGSPITRTLARTRRGVDPISGSRKVFFGQGLVHDVTAPHTLKVRDKLEVKRRENTPNFEEII